VDLRADNLAAVVEDNIEKHPTQLALFRGRSSNIPFSSCCRQRTTELSKDKKSIVFLGQLWTMR
jgi:hypothetical protein